MAAPVPERRRRRLEDEGEEGEYDEIRASRPSECESEGEVQEVELSMSEYESAADESAAPGEEETEEGSETDTEEGSDSETDSGTETEGAYTDEDIGGERQSGDGEEQPENDKVDDDEDKKNPAFVPRKGAFYEHDYRQGDEGEEVEEEEELKPKKKLWQGESKWNHDCYNEASQAPKSREELISLYGYDIRTKDKPPEMPPRRMGRGRGGPRREQKIEDFMPGERPRREQNFQDFMPGMPRMAVIDTTENGSDTIPILDDDGFMEYEGSRERYSERRGGGRGRNPRGSRGPRGSMSSNSRSYHENRRNVYDKESSQDARNLNDFPTLDEISRQTERWDEERRDQKAKGRFLNENDSKRYNPSLRQESNRRDDNHREDRGDHKDAGRYQRSNNNDRRGGYGNNFRNRADEGDWRGSQSDYKNPRDGYNENFKEDYGYRKMPTQHDSRRGDFKSGRSPDSYNGPKNRAGYDQPHGAQYRQQQHIASENGREAKEFTNASYRPKEDRTRQRGGYHEETSPKTKMGDSSDGKPKSRQNVVINNKENVQTINVTITSTSSEKKSYAKERRGKGTSHTDEAVGHLASQDARAVSHAHGSLSDQVITESGSSVSKRYSSQRQQTISKGSFSAPPPPDVGSKLYNPVSSSTLAMPPPTALSVASTPAIFQPPPGPPPPPPPLAAPGVALVNPPYLPPPMIYGGAPRVPPPGTPAGFPLPIAYTSPPPPTTATVVQPQQPPPPQEVTTQTGTESTAQPKKVYRGDIIYYAPEMQQPSRTPQKRPKAAIPIVDPQEIRRQKQKEKAESRSALEKNSTSKKDNISPRAKHSSEMSKQDTLEDSALEQEVQQETLKLTNVNSALCADSPLPTDSGDNHGTKEVSLDTLTAAMNISDKSDAQIMPIPGNDDSDAHAKSIPGNSSSDVRCNESPVDQTVDLSLQCDNVENSKGNVHTPEVHKDIIKLSSLESPKEDSTAVSSELECSPQILVDQRQS